MKTDVTPVTHADYSQPRLPGVGLWRSIGGQPTIEIDRNVEVHCAVCA